MIGMRLRIILIAVLIVGGIAIAQGGLPEPKGGVTIYVVKPGDTLWDISKRFYGNPLLWPRLWELNPAIDNPHKIFPGDVISLRSSQGPQPGIPVVKIAPETIVDPLKDIGAPPSVYYYSQGGQEGFILPDEWEHMGTILSSDPPKILLADGDTVFTNVGTMDGVQSGDIFTIFRTSKPVLHPFTGRRIGYKVAILGELEIKDVRGKRMSTAMITNSFREITRGARIRPHERFVKEVVIKKGTGIANGLVVETENNIDLAGQGDIVYIDVGKADSVVPGNTFTIYTHLRKAYDPDLGDDVTIPPVVKGKLIVFDVEENASTALILKSARQIEIGDPISLDF